MLDDPYDFLCLSSDTTISSMPPVHVPPEGDASIEPPQQDRWITDQGPVHSPSNQLPAAPEAEPPPAAAADAILAPPPPPPPPPPPRPATPPSTTIVTKASARPAPVLVSSPIAITKKQLTPAEAAKIAKQEKFRLRLEADQASISPIFPDMAANAREHERLGITQAFITKSVAQADADSLAHTSQTQWAPLVSAFRTVLEEVGGSEGRSPSLFDVSNMGNDGTSTTTGPSVSQRSRASMFLGAVITLAVQGGVPLRPGVPGESLADSPVQIFTDLCSLFERIAVSSSGVGDDLVSVHALAAECFDGKPTALTGRIMDRCGAHRPHSSLSIADVEAYLSGALSSGRRCGGSLSFGALLLFVSQEGLASTIAATSPKQSIRSMDACDKIAVHAAHAFEVAESRVRGSGWPCLVTPILLLSLIANKHGLPGVSAFAATAAGLFAAPPDSVAALSTVLAVRDSQGSTAPDAAPAAPAPPSPPPAAAAAVAAASVESGRGLSVQNGESMMLSSLFNTYAKPALDELAGGTDDVTLVELFTILAAFHCKPSSSSTATYATSLPVLGDYLTNYLRANRGQEPDRHQRGDGVHTATAAAAAAAVKVMGTAALSACGRSKAEEGVQAGQAGQAGEGGKEGTVWSLTSQLVERMRVYSQPYKLSDGAHTHTSAAAEVSACQLMASVAGHLGSVPDLERFLRELLAMFAPPAGWGPAAGSSSVTQPLPPSRKLTLQEMTTAVSRTAPGFLVPALTRKVITACLGNEAGTRPAESEVYDFSRKMDITKDSAIQLAEYVAHMAPLMALHLKCKNDLQPTRALREGTQLLAQTMEEWGPVLRLTRKVTYHADLVVVGGGGAADADAQAASKALLLLVPSLTITISARHGTGVARSFAAETLHLWNRMDPAGDGRVFAPQLAHVLWVLRYQKFFGCASVLRAAAAQASGKASSDVVAADFEETLLKKILAGGATDSAGGVMMLDWLVAMANECICQGMQDGEGRGVGQELENASDIPQGVFLLELEKASRVESSPLNLTRPQSLTMQ